MPLGISLVTLCSGCTKTAQGESPADPTVSCVPDNHFQISLICLRVGFLHRDTNSLQLLWYNSDSYISTALTPPAGSASSVLIFACSEACLWEVKELIFGFVPQF